MGMVRLAHQLQQTPDENHYQKEQEIERYDPNDPNDLVEVVPVVDAGAVVASNGSLVGGTSTQCSEIDDEDDDEDEDEDEDEEEEDTDRDEGEWVTDLPVSSVINQHCQVALANGGLALPNVDPSEFGDVCIKNSSNVHLGNKTFYKGPVTIKQFVYTNPTSIESQDSGKCSPDDTSYRVSDANVSDLSTSKGDGAASRPILAHSEEYYKVTQWLWTWRCAALSSVLGLILITTIVISSVMLSRNSDLRSAPVFPKIPDSSIDGVIVKNVRFVERGEWGAQPPTEPLIKMKLPVPYVIISHTATQFCKTQAECTYHVRFAQTFHIESRNWSDIAYNFLVGGDGLAYVGRSWDYMGAHSFGFNDKSIGISFIGTFNDAEPPEKQLHAAKKIIELGVKGGKIALDYKLLGHRQVSSTKSPGDALYAIIQKWPHWSPRP